MDADEVRFFTLKLLLEVLFPMRRSNVMQIAKSRTMLTDEEISSMTDGQLWKAIREAKQRKAVKDGRETYFPTGFSGMEKAELGATASALGFRKTSDVNSRTKFVVVGSTPGRGRLEKARAHGCTLMTKAQFLVFARLGVSDVTDDKARLLLG